MDVDKPLAHTGDTLTYTLHGKNLSLAQQTGASVRLKFDPTDMTYQPGSATGTATLTSNCDGDAVGSAGGAGLQHPGAHRRA